MADEIIYDDIKEAIDTGNVAKLKAYWYEKVKSSHEKIFNALGQLEPLIIQADIAMQKAALFTLIEMARNVAGLDMFVAASSVSYTKYSDDVRRSFRIKFKSIETIKLVSKAFIDIGNGDADGYALHAKICSVMDDIFLLACETANIDCFRLLLNGYLRDIGVCGDDDNPG
jgi:hypothetical protein